MGSLPCGGMHACGYRGAGLPREAGLPRGEEIQEQERKHSQESQIQGKQMAWCARSKGGRLNITEGGRMKGPLVPGPRGTTPLAHNQGAARRPSLSSLPKPLLQPLNILPSPPLLFFNLCRVHAPSLP